MKTLRKTVLARVIGIGLAMGLATPLMARPAPQTQSEDAHHEDKAKPQHASPSPQANKPVQHQQNANRPDPHAEQARQQQAAQAQQRQRMQDQQRAQQQHADDQRQRQMAAQQQQREQAERQQRQAQDAQRQKQLAAQQQREQSERQQRQARQQDAQREKLAAQQRQREQDAQRQKQLAAQKQQREQAERQHSLMAQQQQAALKANEARRHANEAHERQRAQARLSEAERQRRIAEERARSAEYRRYVDARQAAERQGIHDLERQRRMQQYQYQQWYWDRQRAQQAQWASHNYSYYSDPFYYTPASYRYDRDGHSYHVNRYAADLLQQAVRYGYEEGVRAGRADRLDRWHNDYRDNYAYLDANYGYNGYYVSRNEYNYYFRQGFQRGYEDGFGRDYRYGRYDNGNYNILASVLSVILNLQPFG